MGRELSHKELEVITSILIVLISITIIAYGQLDEYTSSALHRITLESDGERNFSGQPYFIVYDDRVVIVLYDYQGKNLTLRVTGLGKLIKSVSDKNQIFPVRNVTFSGNDFIYVFSQLNSTHETEFHLSSQSNSFSGIYDFSVASDRPSKWYINFKLGSKHSCSSNCISLLRKDPTDYSIRYIDPENRIEISPNLATTLDHTFQLNTYRRDVKLLKDILIASFISFIFFVFELLLSLYKLDRKSALRFLVALILVIVVSFYAGIS